MLPGCSWEVFYNENLLTNKYIILKVILFNITHMYMENHGTNTTYILVLHIQYTYM